MKLLQTSYKASTLLVVFMLHLLFSCGSSGDGKSEGEQLVEDNNKKTGDVKPKVSDEVLRDIIASIPSPTEISFLLKDEGIQYSSEILNAEPNIKNYDTDYKKALNLGIFSTDLGYANIYNQTQEALFYLNNIKEMADGLKIGQFFDFETIRKLAKSNDKSDENLSELLAVTQTSLESINDHLQEKGRADLTILILTGGWLEALYLTCEVAQKKPNKLLNNRIGEQKIILEQLLLLLSFYEEDDNNDIKGLIADLNELQSIYNNVTITYSLGEEEEEGGSEATVVDDEFGEIVTIEDQKTSQVEFDEKDLESILEISGKIRKKIIK